MPKTKIGEKVTAGESNTQEKKIFTNGHKVFTSMEAKQLNETLSRERETLKNFEKRKANLIAPRNPITGEETPRMVYDDFGNGTMSGTLLFPPRSARAGTGAGTGSRGGSGLAGSAEDPPLTGSSTARRDAQLLATRLGAPNPLKREDAVQERIESLKGRQETIEEELARLRREIEQKEALVRSNAAQVVRF